MKDLHGSRMARTQAQKRTQPEVTESLHLLEASENSWCHSRRSEREQYVRSRRHVSGPATIDTEPLSCPQRHSGCRSCIRHLRTRVQIRDTCPYTSRSGDASKSQTPRSSFQRERDAKKATASDWYSFPATALEHAMLLASCS